MPLSKSQPVFIIGIAHRSGTNFLYSLLLQHSACTKSAAQGEDFLLSQSNLLVSYVDRVAANWNPIWGNDPLRLTRSLETGLMDFLLPYEPDAPKIISKTPVPDNAIHFFKLFSEGEMLLLIRNGQDLTESYVRSFKHRFEYAVRRWIEGAGQICKILNESDPKRVILIKYEDLYPDPEHQLRRIFAFLGIDANQFDYDKARHADVIGSSDTMSKTGNLNWDPVKKHKDFNPMGRAAGWSRWKHYRFNWLAGSYSKQLGYELKYPEKGPSYFLFNFGASAYYYLHHFVFRIIHALRAAKHGKKAAKRAFYQKF